MNRRNFLAGSVALAGQQKLLRSMGALTFGGQTAAPATSPQNLLSTTYPESFLESKLVPPGQWHPYPRCSERGPWEAIPADLRTAYIAKAEADRKDGWNAFDATKMLDFKRNGNRSRFEADSFGRRAKLMHLVLAECMEGKGRFLDDITNGRSEKCSTSSATAIAAALRPTPLGAAPNSCTWYWPSAWRERAAFSTTSPTASGSSARKVSGACPHTLAHSAPAD